MDKVVSQTQNTPENTNRVTLEVVRELVNEFNQLNPKETLLEHVDQSQPHGWTHIRENCENFGFEQSNDGLYTIYSSETHNNFTKFIIEKKSLLLRFI